MTTTDRVCTTCGGSGGRVRDWVAGMCVLLRNGSCTTCHGTGVQPETCPTCGSDDPTNAYVRDLHGPHGWGVHAVTNPPTPFERCEDTFHTTSETCPTTEEAE